MAASMASFTVETPSTTDILQLPSASSMYTFISSHVAAELSSESTRAGARDARIATRLRTMIP